MPDWAERFPYQDGLLISYWDTSFTDNNVGEHPGGGLILPIDAHPEPLIRPDGQPWRTRIQVYDATFGLEKTDAITLHLNGVASTHPSLAAAKTFDDRKDYWFASDPDSGVILPKTGTLIQVINYSAQGNFMQVQVKQAK
jgi:immune inhibitor A